MGSAAKMSDLRTAAQQALEALVSENSLSAVAMQQRMDAIISLKAALVEPDVPATNFGNMEPVGWLEPPHGAFRANPLYKIQFPSQLLSWQIPVFAALAEPQEPVAVHQFRKRGCSDWFDFDGHPDHTDGGGPYVSRTLYTAPPQPLAEPVHLLQQALEALLMMRDRYSDDDCPACDHADAAIKLLRSKQ